MLQSLRLVFMCSKPLKKALGYLAVFTSRIQFSICNRQVPEEMYQKPKAIASKQDFYLAVVKLSATLGERVHVDQQKVPGHHSAIVVLAKWRHNSGSIDRDAEFIGMDRR